MGKTKLAQILMLLEPATVAELNSLAKRTGTLRSDLLREAIADLLIKHTRPSKPTSASKPRSDVAVGKAKADQHAKRPLKTTEDVQEALRKQFEKWSAPCRFASGADGIAWATVDYDRGSERIEIRMSSPVNPKYVGCTIRHGVAEYRRVPKKEMAARVERLASEPYRRARARRIRELHPDKLGRDQTAAERAEYVELTK